MQRPAPAALAALVVAFTATSTSGSLEMTWDGDVALGNWNLILNWIPPLGELPSVPDEPGEAAVIPDYPGTVPTTTTLDMDPVIDYLLLENPDGTLELAGHTLTLLGVEQSYNYGLIVADSGDSTIDGSLFNVGTMAVEPGASLLLTGPEIWNFLGVISVTAGDGSSAVLTLDDVSFPSTPVDFGEIVLDSAFVASVQTDAELQLTGGTFTNNEYHTIRGTGLITGSLFNKGTVQFEGGPGESLRIEGGGSYVNRGTTDVSSLSAGSVFIDDGTVATDALDTISLTVDGGCILTVNDPLVLSGGSVWLYGTMETPGGVALVSSTSLVGTGYVQGHLLNSAGHVSPTTAPLTVDAYTQETGGTLKIDLEASPIGEYSNDLLDVPGVAELGGELEIVIESVPWGFPTPDIGTTFTILTAGELADGTMFETITPEWGEWEVNYDYVTGEVSITVTGWEPCNAPWDLDGNGAINILDFLELLASWGPCPGCPADFDGDGVVGIVDFLQLLAAWGNAGCW